MIEALIAGFSIADALRADVAMADVTMFGASLIALGAFLISGLVVGLVVHLVSRQRLAALQARATDDAAALSQLQSQLTEHQRALQAARIQEAEQQVRRVAVQEQREVDQAQTQLLAEKNDALQAESTRYRERISHLETKLIEQQKQGEEKLALLQEAKVQLNMEFKNIANEIFDAKQKRFSEQSQTQLDGILKPLGERIQAFEKKVEDSYSNEARERFSLIKEVRNLQDINARISKDAINLTNALKGESKTQGTWGEVILERVLEKSGLVKGREYEIQFSAKAEDGRRLQPDVVVHLPEGKDLIIDSKVSLTAYERYCTADDPLVREAELGAHIQSLRQHIKQLSAKDYQNLTGIRTLDFVLLFVPVEAAFSVAVQQDSELFSAAFDKNIVLVAPSTLLATLRTIQNIWRYEQQNKNAQEIADRAGALYDKFVNFVVDLEDIGARLIAVQTSYDKAHNKLASGRGSLVGRAETMRELGAKVSKSLPQSLIDLPQRDMRTDVKSVD
ncbi:MAG: DNA recombination protein RmuC [Candidatus Azotimanducaceae bacterium]|jgi:DNA recombination protein RmuC